MAMMVSTMSYVIEARPNGLRFAPLDDTGVFGKQDHELMRGLAHRGTFWLGKPTGGATAQRLMRALLRTPECTRACSLTRSQIRVRPTCV
jgi:hypothetical protein